MKGPIPIRIAVEDGLSEAVLRRALAKRPVRYAIGAVYSHGGFGYLKKKAGAFNNAAKACSLCAIDRFGSTRVSTRARHKVAVGSSQARFLSVPSCGAGGGELAIG